MKKLFVFLLCLPLSLAALADRQAVQSVEKDSLYYEKEDGVAVVVKSDMWKPNHKSKYGYYPQPKLVIPSQVEVSTQSLSGGDVETLDVGKIGASAFAKAQASSVVFTAPSHVTTVGTLAFSQMANMTGKLVLPASLTHLSVSSILLPGITEIEFQGTTPPTCDVAGGYNPWTSATESTPATVKITIPAGEDVARAYHCMEGLGDYFDDLKGIQCSCGDEPATYTVSFTVQGSSATAAFGSVSPTEVNNVPEGETMTINGATLTIGNTPVTATPAAADAQYTYAFAGWKDANGTAITDGTITSDTTVTAHFSQTTNTYLIQYKDKSATGTDLQPAEELEYGAMPSCTLPVKANTAEYTYTYHWDKEFTAVTEATTYIAILDSTKNRYWVIFQNYDLTELQKTEYAYGEMPHYDNPVAPNRPATAQNTYMFSGWTPALTTVTGTQTYTATFTETPIAQMFYLYDNRNQGDGYYTTLAEKATSQEVLNVTYVRDFAPGWNAFSLPFDYSFVNEANQTFRDKVLSLDKAEYGNGWMKLIFTWVTKKIEANKPYVIYTEEAISNPVFENVTMKALADKTYSVTLQNGASGSVDFINTTYRKPLFQNNVNEDKKTIYIRNTDGTTRLVYPTAEVYMRAFRGYFRLNIADADIQHLPLRITMEDEDGELATDILEMAPVSESNSVRKYIENGVLIIERNGVKYDAQGNRVEK